MKVKITEMQDFLTAVDDCAGDVYLVYPQGGRENLKGNYTRQAELVDEWRAAGQCLTLTVDVEEGRDHRRLKHFAV